MIVIEEVLLFTSFLNFDVVAAHLSLAHLSIIGERPVLKTIASLPLHLIMRILVLIPKLHSNFFVSECEELLPQLITLLPLPLLSEESFDRHRTREEG